MKSTIEDLVAGWSDEYKKLAAPAIKEIQRLLAAGDAPDSAVRKAFYKFGIDEKLAGTLLDSATKAAARGLGIPGVSANQSARDKLERLPWTPDNMPLSQRLHGASATMRQRIVSEIDGALAQGGNWKAIAKNLYDGYGFPTTINSAALPTYLDELLKASRTMDNGAELRAALRKANRQIKLLGQNGAPNQALKAAYRQIVRAVESGSDKRIDNAVRVGVEEKSRYHAERIARTEIARAWSEGFWAEHGPDELTVAVAWKLSSRHPIYDICDFHAHANLYGLGPGVYPKDRAPRLPAHPHCTCHLSPVFEGEVGQPDVDPQHVLHRGADYLRGLDDYERQRLLTIEGEKAWRAGDSWQNQLRNWQGHGDNRPRLTKEDFTVPVSIPAGPVFTPAKTIKEAEAFAVKHIADNANYKGIPLEIANAWNEAQFNVQRQFPELRELSNFTGSAQERNKYNYKQRYDRYMEDLRQNNPSASEALLESLAKRRIKKPARIAGNTWAESAPWGKDGGGISLNESWFTSKKISEFWEDLTRSETTRWHPVGCGTPKSLADHELGHQIDNLLQLRKDPDLILLHVKAQKAGDIKEGLSEYAKKNAAEFIAEGWSEFINNPNPRPYAQEIGKLILQKYSQKVKK